MPTTARNAFTTRICERDPHAILEAFGPRLNRKPDLDSMPFDLPIEGPVQFEHLAGLFASTSLDHSVLFMTTRQGAYLFGLIRQMRARKVIEIGRYKGGSTLLIAAAMGGQGDFWSIDNREKEDRLHGEGPRPFDEQIADVCGRLGLKVELIVADSRTVEIETGEADLVFIDGDHSYEGVKSDFDRFGRRVRIGGAVLFDDVFEEDLFKTHDETVGRFVDEIVSTDEFKLVMGVNRMAHLERVQGDTHESSDTG